jgi:hypothetical protein
MAGDGMWWGGQARPVAVDLGSEFDRDRDLQPDPDPEFDPDPELDRDRILAFAL